MLGRGIEKNMQKPGTFTSENFKAGHSGRFLAIIAIDLASTNSSSV